MITAIATIYYYMVYIIIVPIFGLLTGPEEYKLMFIVSAITLSCSLMAKDIFRR